VNRGVCTALEQKGIKLIQEKNEGLCAHPKKRRKPLKWPSQETCGGVFKKQKLIRHGSIKIFKAVDRAEKGAGL